MDNKNTKAKAEKARMKALPGGNMGYDLAAATYVKSGIKKLKLTPGAEADLYAKLRPIVARQMASERGRTATRAAGIAKRESKKK